jgi:hypothetical protein
MDGQRGKKQNSSPKKRGNKMGATAGTPTVIINNFNVFEAILPITLAGSYVNGGGVTLDLTGIVPSNSAPLLVELHEQPPAGTVASGIQWIFSVGTTQANGKIQAFVNAGFTPAGTNAASTLTIGAGTPGTYPVGTAANSGSTTLVATGAVTVPLAAQAFTGTAVAAIPAVELGSVTFASVSAANLSARVVYKKFM